MRSLNSDPLVKNHSIYGYSMDTLNIYRWISIEFLLNSNVYENLFIHRFDENDCIFVVLLFLQNENKTIFSLLSALLTNDTIYPKEYLI